MELTMGQKTRNIIITSIFLLVVVVISLIVILRVSFFRINGNSMEPTLNPGDLVLSVPGKNFERGDLIAFDLEGVITIKRIIGIPGDIVFIEDDGTVYLNDKELKEDYIKAKHKGDVEVPNPYKVQDNEYYVLGDNREDSKDSRLLKVGAIKEGQIKAKIVASISKFKIIK